MADPPAAPRRAPDDPLVQMNVRIPKSLRDAVDERRYRSDTSRDKWVGHALAWALEQSPAEGTLRTSRGRTAPPPRHRT